jgi:hypothetical protein
METLLGSPPDSLAPNQFSRRLDHGSLSKRQALVSQYVAWQKHLPQIKPLAELLMEYDLYASRTVMVWLADHSQIPIIDPGSFAENSLWVPLRYGDV